MSKDKKKEVVTQDPRFAKVYSDPRFKVPKRKDLKVAVDDRFSKDELKMGKKKKLDKFGRKVKEDKKSDFEKYYKKEDESESESESEASDTTTSVLDRARGLVSEDSESEESDSDSEVVSEDEEDDEEAQEGVPEGEPTSTFAVVNLDWDHITSADLFATFIGFVPKDGKILSVSIYPSEYGKQRMQQEEIEGPPKELFKSKKVESDSDDDDELDMAKAAKKLYEEDDGTDYNSKALRLYQLQRLRYYYAIVKCDSVATSRAIYESCDGTEYESTANHFDLRYVPEDMTFDDAPRDECLKIPAKYRPNAFTTDALQHSKVKLTWDETPAERVTMASRAFSQKEIDDMDFKAYLASDSEESDHEAAAKYKSLVAGALESKEDDVDMEVSFNPGLSEEKTDATEESTIDKIKRKEKERRKKRKEKVKELKKATEEEKRAAKQAVKQKKHEQDEKSKAELELLMMDEEKEHEHFDMKQMLKEEKKKRKEKKKKGKAVEEETAGVDLEENDTRFNEIFEDHAFAIDPTHSEFKRTSTMEKLMKKRARKEGGSKTEKLGDLVAKIKRRK
ncbi:hypothetical protein OGAPHI_000494 [Ogataea philodendri]|uniref:NUC153 domain-containing protein n=1 Tax=Ogataea philodendri TaxID=1378263 RepID=A0A9P8TAN4_9ASCO|nr:uncharacterized protein OGAPHI_000494 [Ogataea philodendri]KAH3671271.1 hypothetical protein OGAPHI_000494 [Ogataea philodendri]